MKRTYSIFRLYFILIAHALFWRFYSLWTSQRVKRQGGEKKSCPQYTLSFCEQSFIFRKGKREKHICFILVRITYCLYSPDYTRKLYNKCRKRKKKKKRAGNSLECRNEQFIFSIFFFISSLSYEYNTKRTITLVSMRKQLFFNFSFFFASLCHH